MKGKCFCGAIEFRLTAKHVGVVNCHCNFCRSHTGAAFASYAALRRSEFQIDKGQEALRSFTVDEGSKHFCSECGTPLFNLNSKYPRMCMVYLGTLENAGTLVPGVNLWCESKLGWVDTLASLPARARGMGKS